MIFNLIPLNINYFDISLLHFFQFKCLSAIEIFKNFSLKPYEIQVFLKITIVSN